MKKTLLLFGLISAYSVQSQTITVNDTLSTGDMMNYYAGDTSFTNYDAITGAGVTWDYSSLGYADAAETNSSLDTIIERENSTYSTDYAAADYEDNFQTSIRSFFSNEPTKTLVHGFVFDEGGNTYQFIYNDDPLESMQYDMTLGSTYTDNIEGEATSSQLPALVPNVDVSGSATVTADGTGTLKLGSETYTDVIRIKTVEDVSGTLPAIPGIFAGGPVSVLRTSYVYYSPSTSNMPIFVYGGLAAEFATIGTINFKTLWSKDPLVVPSSVGVNDNELISLSIYPNPAHTDVMVISEHATELVIVNSIGKEVKTIISPATTEVIDVNNLTAGIYFVQIKKGNSVLTKKLVIK